MPIIAVLNGSIQSCQSLAIIVSLLLCRRVWPGIPIDLCNWHVKKAWVKNLNSKVHHANDRQELFKDLSAIMHGAEFDQLAGEQQLLSAVNTQMQAFRIKWSCYPAFIQYFTEQWMHRPGKSRI